MDKGRVVCCKSNIGEIVLVFSHFRAVYADAFIPLWCAQAFDKYHVGVLISGLD